MNSNATATGLKVRSIDHVTIIVADLERSRQFYCDVLGMQQVERPAFKFPGLWFQAGATQVHLILEFEGCAPPGYAAAAAARAGLAHHFAFEVDDAPRAAEQLTAAGVQIMGGPNNRPDGCIQVWCYDPDGHVVEVFHRPQ
ncbi:MAG: VOC family protein [Pirellulales bacterium]